MGVSRDAQLRALKLLDVVLEEDGKEIFEFGHTTMRKRWMRLREIISQSKHFSLQKLTPQYCSFFKRVKDPSPGNQFNVLKISINDHIFWLSQFFSINVILDFFSFDKCHQPFLPKV